MIGIIGGQGHTADQLLSRISALQNDDGGWGATEGAVSNSECTALACLAFQASNSHPGGAFEAPEAGLQWLLSRQDSSGVWFYSEQAPVAPWPTAIVLLSLRQWPEAHSAARRGYDRLLATRGVHVDWMTRIRQFLSGNELVELDAMLDGWPWVPDTFSWVEPTSWALMALKAEWPAERPRAVLSRIRDGENLLLDRACVDGGWNYGNRTVLGADLAAYPDTTALGLMALRGRPDPAIDSGFRALDTLLGEHASILSLSLATLSRRAWRRRADELVARLTIRLEESDAVDNRSLALAALAYAPRIDWLEAPPNA